MTPPCCLLNSLDNSHGCRIAGDLKMSRLPDVTSHFELPVNGENAERASTGLSGKGDSNAVSFPRPQPLLGDAKTVK
jgi:hypothetical protein